MYYLQLISLQNCPYSEAANSLVKDNNIKHNLTIVNREEKDKFKTEYIDTFPQIYLKKKNSSGSVLLGGYDNLKEYYDSVKKNYGKKDSLENIKSVIKKSNIDISEKSILRLIELLI